MIRTFSERVVKSASSSKKRSSSSFVDARTGVVSAPEEAKTAGGKAHKKTTTIDRTMMILAGISFLNLSLKGC
jgi:hypothetical protein